MVVPLGGFRNKEMKTAFADQGGHLIGAECGARLKGHRRSVCALGREPPGVATEILDSTQLIWIALAHRSLHRLGTVRQRELVGAVNIGHVDVDMAGHGMAQSEEVWRGYSVSLRASTKAC